MSSLVIARGVSFAMQAGVYYWLPKWTGNMYDIRLATWHFWLSAISVNVLFFPQHFLGLAGMPAPDSRLCGAIILGRLPLTQLWSHGQLSTEGGWPRNPGRPG
jgi:hypothetical protein